MTSLVAFFSNRHLLSNIVFVGVLLMGMLTWFSIGKEELPEFEGHWLRVTTVYPGAPPEDVEIFVTKPMEEELKGVPGIDEVVTTSSLGVSSLRIILDDRYPDMKSVVQEIQDAILRAKLPSEVRDLPRIRQFKSSEKAILDVGIYRTDKKILDPESREELQQFVLSFENQLLAKKEISSISRSHYRKPELQIIVDPKKIKKNEISLAQVKSQIQANHIRYPIGSLVDRGESKVSAVNELETTEALQNLVLRGNFEGYGVKLSDISSSIRRGHIKTNSIFKVNGHEAIFLNIRKSVSTDILTAQRATFEYIEKFKAANKGANIGITLMDDESYAVRNRLQIIGFNGLLGFTLIILVLFVFLDIKTGFWVGMGIPFSMGFTLIIASLTGYTVNSMTLAGIIIVLGVVVDDAIIIAENISRKREQGLSKKDASVVGAMEVFRPIMASIITTCVAFIPLLFFEGFFGKLVKYIPLIVILMLLGSLLESLFVLPSHLSGKTYLLERFAPSQGKKSWFHRLENTYETLLMEFFKLRVPITLGFVVFLGGALWLFQSQMKFVMFPREESKEVFIKIKTDKNSTREETSALIGPLEKFLADDTKNVVGVRSSVGLSRRGGQIKENEASILVELFPTDDRQDSLNELLDRWKTRSDKMKELEVKYQRGRWGHGSGNAIELQVQENDDGKREATVKKLVEKMQAFSDLTDVEAAEPLKKKEYSLELNQKNMIRLDVDPANIMSVLRSYAEGSILYSINKGEEEVDVRLSVPEVEKTSISKLLDLRVNNQRSNLIQLRNLLKIKEEKKPVNITRTNYKRTSMIYANMDPKSDSTPLEIAEKLESEVFPDITSESPSTVLTFKGEIEDTRESQGEFLRSVIIVICLIFFILAVLFNSLTLPFLILSIVPFGLSGLIYILWLHGMSVYGFFAAIGALGMIGVVVNDAIVMIDKIEKSLAAGATKSWQSIASVASTRLRPVLLTTTTTMAGILPTAYGVIGYDSMLAEMMLAMGWGLGFGTIITLVLIPCLYSFRFARAQ